MVPVKGVLRCCASTYCFSSALARETAVAAVLDAAAQETEFGEIIGFLEWLKKRFWPEALIGAF